MKRNIHTNNNINLKKSNNTTENDMELKSCESVMTAPQEKQYNTLVDLIEIIKYELYILNENEKNNNNYVNDDHDTSTSTDYYNRGVVLEGLNSIGGKDIDTYPMNNKESINTSMTKSNKNNKSNDMNITMDTKSNINTNTNTNISTENSYVSAEKIHLLLQQQKDNISLQIDDELHQQSQIESELVQLTGVLKSVTLDINRTVVQQNIVSFLMFICIYVYACVYMCIFVTFMQISPKILMLELVHLVDSRRYIYIYTAHFNM